MQSVDNFFNKGEKTMTKRSASAKLTLNKLLKVAIIFWLVVDALTTLGWNIKNLLMGVEL